MDSSRLLLGVTEKRTFPTPGFWRTSSVLGAIYSLFSASLTVSLSTAKN